MNNLLTRFRQLYGRFFDYVSYLQSPFLLFVRLYWGVQLIQSGWGKLHNLEKVTEFFSSLNLPMPAQTALASSPEAAAPRPRPRRGGSAAGRSAGASMRAGP